jgi:hypothetical protein
MAHFFLSEVRKVIVKMPRNVEWEEYRKQEEAERKARLKRRPWERFPRQR